MYAAVDPTLDLVTVQGLSLNHAAVCAYAPFSWLAASDSTAQFCCQVKPLATINVGPRMNLPQQEVMYDLVGFVVRTGGSELSKARFKTFASAPSGRWFLFDEGEDVREVCCRSCWSGCARHRTVAASTLSRHAQLRSTSTNMWCVYNARFVGTVHSCCLCCHVLQLSRPCYTKCAWSSLHGYMMWPA